MTEQQTPTPIDPADIRPGDVVEARRRSTVAYVNSVNVVDKDGLVIGSIAPAVTWHLVHRPDPDAEAVQAMLEAGVTDDADLIESDTARVARRYLANLREKGWDVTRRRP